MIRTLVLGVLGVVLAIAVGLGVHLVTRETISLPVVRLDPAPALAPPAATVTEETTTEETTTEETTTEPETDDAPATTEDNSGQGRGRGRGRSGGDSGGNSGPGGGDD